MDNVSVDTIRFDEAATNGAAITLTDLAGTITDFHYSGAGTLNDDLTFSPVVIDYDVTSAIAAATIRIDNGGKVGDDITLEKIDIDNVTALTINATEVGQAAADEVTIDEIEGDNITDLVMTSDGEVIIAEIDGDIIDTIDFSGADKGVAVTGTNGLSDSAAAVTVTMGDGDDTFEVSDTAAAVTIDLGAGNDLFISDTGIDTITTGTGVDTVRLTGASDDDDNIVTDFTAGSGGDILDFATNGANDGGTTLANIETISGGTDDVLEAGFVIIDNGNANIANADALTVAGIVDRLNDLSNDNNGNATDDIVSMEATNDDNYVAISDGTDTAIVLIYDADANDTTIENADVHILAILEGVGDAGTLTTANLADFV